VRVSQGFAEYGLKSKQTWWCEALFLKLCFRKFSKLFALSVISNFKNNQPSGNLKGKHPFKALCWNINKN